MLWIILSFSITPTFFNKQRKTRTYVLQDLVQERFESTKLGVFSELPDNRARSFQGANKIGLGRPIPPIRLLHRPISPLKIRSDPKRKCYLFRGHVDSSKITIKIKSFAKSTQVKARTIIVNNFSKKLYRCSKKRGGLGRLFLNLTNYQYKAVSYYFPIMCFRRRVSNPTKPKPEIIMPQVEASGTAAVMVPTAVHLPVLPLKGPPTIKELQAME